MTELVDPFKLNTYGVKMPLDQKIPKIQELFDQQKRYYPMDRKGNIDEWGAIVHQQQENFRHQNEEQHLKERQRVLKYGDELRFEQLLREKQKEIERYDKFNDLELVNRKKEEYDQMLNHWKSKQHLMQDYLAEDYKQSMKDHQRDTQSKRMQQQQEEKLANQRVEHEMQQLQQIGQQKKQMVKDMLYSDINDRKKLIAYENSIKQNNKQDANILMSENSGFALDAQERYKNRYALFQDKQKHITNNYYQTVKAPQIEQRVVELEKIQQQSEQMKQQSAETEMMKNQLKREFAVNNKQLLMKQLEDKEKMKYLKREMKDLDLDESVQKSQEFHTYEQQKQQLNQQRKLTYKEMLDNQINLKQQLKIYGNMTSVEKQMNKDDLEFYKNNQVQYTAMIPGMSHLNTMPQNISQIKSPVLEKEKKDRMVEEHTRRLNQFGYNNQNTTLLNQGSQTARNQSIPGFVTQRESVHTIGTTMENPLNQTLDKNASLRKSSLLDIGMKAMQQQEGMHPRVNQSVGSLISKDQAVMNLKTSRYYNNPIVPRLDQVAAQFNFAKPLASTFNRLY